MLKRTPIWLKKSAFFLQAILAGLGIAFLWILISGRGIPVSGQAGQHFNPVASFADAVERAQPAVVSIQTSKVVLKRRTNNPWTQGRREQGLGSGVIIREDGLVLTNYHVVNGADSLLIILPNGSWAPATIVGVDKDTDLALLKIEKGGVNIKLPTLNFANSSKQHIGDVVLAIGNPYGLGQTVTQGIISATGKANINLANFEDFIQTDATISIGNSGGALINTEGELIGINTAVSEKSGLALAIPAELAKGVVEEILKNGRVIRGWLGFEEGVAQKFVPPPRGTYITNVYPNSPAFYVGLKRGDILLNINDIEVNSDLEAKYTIASLKPGEKVKLSIQRGELAEEIQIEVAERPPNLTISRS